MRTALLVLVSALTLTSPTAAAAPVWVQHEGPVLKPSQPWEGNALQEPTVLRVGGVYRMWYTAVSDGDCALGYATSKDGVTWKKYGGNPIRGTDGMWACHNSVTYYNGFYFLYYSTLGSHGGITNPELWVAASRDGIHFGSGRVVVQPSAESYGMANTAVFRDAPGRWVMFYDSVPLTGGLWKMHMAVGKGPLGPFVQQGGPVDALSVGGVTGAPSIRKIGGVYQLWYLASAVNWVLPTDVYYSESRNLTDWTVPQLAVKREQPWQTDQIADPSVVGDRMWFAGLDNESRAPDVVGGIGMATLR